MKEKEGTKIDENYGNNLEASNSYTNKSTSVKAVFWSNRSTPSLVKPGKTVKAKNGYGKRTKVRNLTQEELKDARKGKWIRTRESGKKHNEKGAKQSKFRPQLAKKSREAKRRKLAASDYVTFIASARES